MNTGRPRILLVDDDVDTCKLLPALLQTEGDNYHITTSHSFHGAQLLMSTLRFDLFITEYFIPNDQTVSAFCHSIKLVSPNSPFIVYSNFDEKKAKDDASASGVDLYLVKPNDQDKICSSVRDLIQKKSAHDQPYTARPVRRSSTNIL
jgi:DNA-binding NtrC family response regulator